MSGRVGGTTLRRVLQRGEVDRAGERNGQCDERADKGDAGADLSTIIPPFTLIGAAKRGPVALFINVLAAGVLALIPSCLFFIFIQRYLVQGLTSGAVKG